MVVTACAVAAGCSNHRDPGSQAIQPEPLWSTHLDRTVDWGPDVFGPVAIQANSNRVFVAGYTSDSGGAYQYGWTAAFSSLTGDQATGFGNSGVLVVDGIFGIRGLGVTGGKLLLFGGRPWNNTPPEPPEAGRLQQRDITDGTHISTSLCGQVAFGSVAARAMILSTDSVFLLFDDYTSLRLERRLLADGSLVTTFGSGGFVSAARGDHVRLALTGNDLYLLRGDQGMSPWQLEKRSADNGTLDPAFGTGGVIDSQPAESGEPAGLVADANGVYVLVAGGAYALSRRSPANGALVTTFGTSGITSPSAIGVTPTALALHAGTLFVAASETLSATDSQWRIDAFDGATGEPAVGFGLEGAMRRNVSDRADVPAAIAVDDSGVIVTGRIRSSTSQLYSSEILVEKYTR